MFQTKFHSRTGLLLLYFASYIASSAFFQLRSEVPPWVDGAPIEYFTGGILWMSSLIGLLMAGLLIGRGWRGWLWLGVSAGLAFLALDELFTFHEQTSKFLGNDDHVKVLLWLFAGGVLYLVDRFDISSLKTKSAFIIGYVIHGLYLLSDVGDGDYFSIPLISMSQLRWTEEYLELFSLTAYCMGLILLYTNTFRTTMRHNPWNSTALLNEEKL